MKIYLKFASIPLAMFIILFGIPRLIATLFNSQTDMGIVGVVVIVCGLFSVAAAKLYNELKKEMSEDER